MARSGSKASQGRAQQPLYACRCACVPNYAFSFLFCFVSSSVSPQYLLSQASETKDIVRVCDRQKPNSETMRGGRNAAVKGRRVAVPVGDFSLGGGGGL